jgi:uroporphyrinogen III methyltransferase/synthase
MTSADAMPPAAPLVVVLRAGAPPSRVTTALESRLSGTAWQVAEVPTLAFEWTPQAELAAALSEVAADDVVVFTSANAVRAVAEAGLAATVQRAALVAAAGRVTAAVIRRQLGVRSVLVPERFVAESLAEMLVAAGVAGRTVWLPRAELARETLPEALSAAGASVHTVVAYRAVTAPVLEEGWATRLFEGARLLVACSSRTLRALDGLVPAAMCAALRDLPVASIGPITTATASEMGYRVVVEPAESTMDALAACAHAWLMTGETR